MRGQELPTASAAKSEEAALKKASWAALRAGMLPATFRACITGHEVNRDTYRRVAHQIERRTVAFQVSPAHGSKKREEQLPPDPGGVDPWAVDPHQLPSASRRVSRCPACQGDKKVNCPVCAGHGRVDCDHCGGDGKVRGQRGLKNCPVCRGRGTKKCSHCRQGRIRCPTCDAVGRVHAWLEIRSERFLQLRASPQTGVAALHDGLLSPEDLDRDPKRFRIPLDSDSGWIDTLPSPLGPELAAEVSPRTDRVLAHRLQRFGSQVFQFAYATRVGDGLIKVAGDPPGVLAESTWRPLHVRLAIAAAVGFVVFVLGSQVHGAYRAQALWFHGNGNGGAIALLSFASMITAGAATAGLLLPAAARTLVRVGLPMLLTACGWTLIAALFVVGGPSIEGVEEALERGDVAAAHLELDALDAVATRSDATDAARERLAAKEAEERRKEELAEDRAHLERLRQTPTSLAAMETLREPWNSAVNEAEARGSAIEIATAEVEARFEAKDEEALLKIAAAVEDLDPKLTARARSRATLSRASRCMEADEAQCAATALKELDRAADDEAAKRAREHLEARLVHDLRARIGSADVDSEDLDTRHQAIQTALADVRVLEELAPDEKPPKTAEHLRKLLDKVKAAKRKRDEAEARAARRAAEQTARELARQRRLSDRVSCCDGTLSPTCRYSRGSLRGCCSHHGGVC